jgi:hypothetical protein
LPFTEHKELINIIASRGISDADVFGAEAIERNDPRYQLYRGIRDDSFNTQEEAARAIYNGSPSDNNFKLIRSRLRQRLIDVVVQLDPGKKVSMSEYQNATNETSRGVYEVRSLVSNGALGVARSEAERLLAIAIKYDLFEPAAQFARFLRSQYAYLGDKKKSDDNALLYRNYLSQAIADGRAEQIIDEVALIFITSADDRPEGVVKLEALRQEIKMLHASHPTFTITVNYYRIHSYAAHALHKHDEAAQWSIEAIAYLEMHPHLSSKSRIAEFANYIMNEYQTIGKFDEAEKYATICFDNCATHSNQWYGAISMYFVLALHRADYSKAMDVFRKAVAPAMQSQPKYNQERWKLYAGYLLYLHQSEQTKLSKKDVEVLSREFKREKFSFAFNYDLEVYTKDKTGMRIPILILEFLYTLEEGKLNDLFALQEKLRAVYYRWLKPELYPRANAFFHLLQILLQENLDAVHANKRGAKDIALLNPKAVRSSKKRKSTDFMEGLEILRYEVLWNIISERVAVLKDEGKLN